MTHGIDRGAKSARRQRAMAREADRNDRSPDDQLALLDQRPGESRRERARLSK